MSATLCSLLPTSSVHTLTFFEAALRLRTTKLLSLLGGAVGGAVGGVSLLRPVDGLPCGEGSALESGVVADTICKRLSDK